MSCNGLVVDKSTLTDIGFDLATIVELTVTYGRLVVLIINIGGSAVFFVMYRRCS